MIVTLLEIRGKVLRFCSRYDRYVKAGLRFITALLSMLVLSGFAGRLNVQMPGMPVVLGLSAAAAVLPGGVITAEICTIALYLTWQISLECFSVLFLCLILFLILYYSFHPHYGIIMGLTVVSCLMGLPQLAIFLIALFFSPFSFIPLGMGLIVGRYLNYILQNLSTFTKVSEGTSQISVDSVITLVKEGLLGREMLYLLLCFLVVAALIYVIRRQSFQWSRTIAVAGGAFLWALMQLIGVLLETNGAFGILSVLGTVLSAAIAITAAGLVRLDDYSKVEYVQFEDDDYYYYVKAVPKLVLSPAESKVKSFSRQSKQKDEDLS